MPPEISTLQLPAAATPAAPRLMALPPRYEVSPETRRLLIALLEEEDEEAQASAAAPIVDMAAYRARRLL